MNIYSKVFDSPLEFFQFCEKNAMSNKSSHEVGGDRDEFTGTRTFKEAKSLIESGWEPSKMKASTNRITLRSVKQRMLMKRDNYGSTLLIDRYAEGLDKPFRRKYRKPKLDRHITIGLELNEIGSITKEQIFLKACVIGSIVENLRLQNISCSIYGYYAIASNDSKAGGEYGVIDVVPIKRRSQRLQLYKLGAMLHPSCFRRLYFGRLENAYDSPDNPMAHLGKYPMGMSYGWARTAVSDRAKSLTIQASKDERIIFVPQIRHFKYELHNEEDAARWVNAIVESCNAMFHE